MRKLAYSKDTGTASGLSIFSVPKNDPIPPAFAPYITKGIPQKRHEGQSNETKPKKGVQMLVTATRLVAHVPPQVAVTAVWYVALAGGLLVSFIHPQGTPASIEVTIEKWGVTLQLKGYRPQDIMEIIAHALQIKEDLINAVIIDGQQDKGGNVH